RQRAAVARTAFVEFRTLSMISAPNLFRTPRTAEVAHRNLMEWSRQSTTACVRRDISCLFRRRQRRGALLPAVMHDLSPCADRLAFPEECREGVPGFRRVAQLGPQDTYFIRCLDPDFDSVPAGVYHFNNDTLANLYHFRLFAGQNQHDGAPSL